MRKAAATFSFALERTIRTFHWSISMRGQRERPGMSMPGHEIQGNNRNRDAFTYDDEAACKAACKGLVGRSLPVEGYGFALILHNESNAISLRITRWHSSSGSFAKGSEGRIDGAKMCKGCFRSKG